MQIEPFEAYRHILRTHFMAIVVRAFLELHPNIPFYWNWHLEVICAKLMDVMAGKIKRLIITLPPRSLKSHIVSECFPAYVLGHRPHTRILCASYGQALSETFAIETLQLMQSPFYRSIFDIQLAREAVADFSTSELGGRFTTSVGGVTTGRGGDILILDDLLKADEAASDTCRGNVNNWMSSVAYSRLNDKKEGAIIIVMQRLHEDDLVGHLLERDNWEVVSFPAIATEDESHVIDTPFGRRRYGRKEGEALHSEREDLASLNATRTRIGSAAFAAQYQQDPTPAEGALVKPAWFPRYAPEDLPKSFDRIIISWDTAIKITDISDYSVGTVWGTMGDGWELQGEDIFLLDDIRGKWESPELERKVIEAAEHYANLGPVITLIEDCSSGQQLNQRISRLDHVVKPCKPEGDKKMRLYSQLPTMERGRVHLPRQAPWLKAYLDELRAFPNGRHDDQVDSTSQALRWIGQNPRDPAWIAYVRSQLSSARAPEPQTSFRVQYGVNIWRLPNGKEIYPNSDGVITVSGELVRWARGSGFTEIPRTQ